MEEIKSLIKDRYTVTNKVLCRNLGIWPANIISEMLVLSTAHEGGWFPMEWQYLRDEFGVKGRSKIESAIKVILDCGLFETELRYVGSAPKKCYRLLVDFDDWFYHKFGGQLWPREPNLIVLHSNTTREILQNPPILGDDEILPKVEILQNPVPTQLADNEEFEENDLEKIIEPSNSIIVFSNSNKKCRKNSPGEGVKFYDFYRDNKKQVNAMLSRLGVPIKTCYEKIDEYYSRMTHKSKLRTEDDWLNRLSRYITMYSEPEKLDHTGTSISAGGNSDYWNWVHNSLEKKRRAL